MLKVSLAWAMDVVHSAATAKAEQTEGKVCLSSGGYRKRREEAVLMPRFYRHQGDLS